MDDARLNAFWSYQQRRGRSPRTRIQYAVYLEPFMAWIGDRDLDAITARDIELDWLGSWEADFQRRHGRMPAPKTVANHLTALCAFFDFLERYDYVARNVVRRITPPKVTQRANDWLRPDEDDAMLAACQSPQERIVVPFLRFTGLRSGDELHGLTNADVDLAAGTITVRASKTPRGRRVLPIQPELVPHIERWQRYLKAIGQDAPTAPFFATRNGTPMRHKQVYEVVKRVATRGGVRVRRPTGGKWDTNTSGVTPHTLRQSATCCTPSSMWTWRGRRFGRRCRALPAWCSKAWPRSQLAAPWAGGSLAIPIALRGTAVAVLAHLSADGSGWSARVSRCGA